MTDHQHPITPPPELMQQWDDEGTAMFRPEYQQHLTARAAQWGADQELEACCAELPGLDDYLRAARRPEPPSLKEQAIDALERVDGYPKDIQNIFRALEALDD